jgi:hypothetical protein
MSKSSDSSSVYCHPLPPHDRTKTYVGKDFHQGATPVNAQVSEEDWKKAFKASDDKNLIEKLAAEKSDQKLSFSLWALLTPINLPSVNYWSGPEPTLYIEASERQTHRTGAWLLLGWFGIESRS